MKKFITPTIFLTLLISGIMFSRCKKFLDVDPAYTQDAENYFNSPADYEMALTGAYDLLQACSIYSVWIGEIASDNTIAGGESVNDTEGLHQIDLMTHGGVNTELRNVFRWNYAGISRANFILENKDNIEFTGKDVIIAEAKFLRALYYFDLVKFFGDVPLVIDKRLGAEEAIQTPRAPSTDVYNQIESDLQDAISVLSPTTPIIGRATKGAAQSILGKVYLYQNKFSEAATQFDAVIASGMYNLIADYADLFSVANENHSETVFDVQYSGLEGGGYGCLSCLEGYAGPGFHGIRQYNGPVYGDGNSYNLPTQNLYDAFDPADPRRDLTVLDIDAFIAAQPSPADITYAIGAGGHTGYYNNKYIKRQGEFGLPDNDLTSPVNYRMVRYADVLLMAAEAHFQTGNVGIAEGFVNEIRIRAGMPTITVSTLQDIWTERRLELACEGHRFFDLVRTNQAAIHIDGFQANKNELFPIPQIEIDLVGGNWTQNTGY
ncbi:MAG: RagB/SusD family nutrient uptake outer membrane protein [Crocinitomicaceae bacterium]|jgi:starch-binding outer membrane protein, SusD/RagB family|nr:RagB/SusD family nutrient uptake outer membrane protein [Crocinitomicaceae bacterium]MBT5403776.1 RagB/SusD family nutrient uptake outer membrane protein [Crocinitomicaceae bacterium]MBT6029772.1 RagB/SusD family nutrient uptake outer membrane protein [Crocinitomicaceae bacterium]MBT6513187.1 RagB/SusD family nutrient uptake outer membrane protein [Crocinitomicaceae bacterium]